ncbi:hypothetical protein T265_11766 [Opisthorchis viverrini]|uniref:Uncharacterized protein n=1 Tax=Opisthorchis viverrini TaxID=6198 RepID=A0A074Z1V0_OPIVI|nr:hypothetical protein T265_11766 [Opisthorchis viverrini]KER19472.1 hypothetical protein T265_11766 [Opisthorchis viverrini]
MSDVRWKRFCVYHFRTTQTRLAVSTEVSCCGYSKKVRVTSLFSYGNKYMIGTENGVIKEGHFHILCRIVALFLLLPFTVTLMT